MCNGFVGFLAWMCIFFKILQDSGPEMTFWDSFRMILHGFVSTNFKNTCITKHQKYNARTISKFWTQPNPKQKTEQIIMINHFVEPYVSHLS